MIGEVCRFYHWSYRDVLDMPIISFFAMRASSFKIATIEKLDQCDIQAISICNEKYYLDLKAKFTSQIEVEETEETHVEDKKYIEGEEAKNLFMMIGNNLKRGG